MYQGKEKKVCVPGRMCYNNCGIYPEPGERDLRIIAGSLKGRRLQAEFGSVVRPTTDRVREALFNILARRVPGSRFLDLYAGTGAVGLEALSRDASLAVFVEHDRRVAAQLKRRLAETGLAGRSQVRVGKAAAVITALGEEGRVFDLVFMDPPYSGDLAAKTLSRLFESGVVDPAGWVIAESSFRRPPPEKVGGLCVWRRERYGESLLSFYRVEEGSG